MEPYEPDDDTLVDLTPEEPFGVSSQLWEAISQVQNLLYEEGCGVNGIVITVPDLEGTETKITTDFGEVRIVPEEIE